MSPEFYMLGALSVKHFICDFPLQATPYMYGNKGTYGHPGGMLHAFIHAAGTTIALSPFTSSPGLVVTLALIDFLLHYHIDWAKMNIGRIYNLKADNSEWFWILLGLDQLLHAATYMGLVYLMVMA